MPPTFCFAQGSAKSEQWRVFQLQFRAEETLFSDSSNNELFVINLATVRAERNTNFPQSRKRCMPLIQTLKRIENA